MNKVGLFYLYNKNARPLSSCTIIRPATLHDYNKDNMPPNIKFLSSRPDDLCPAIIKLPCGKTILKNFLVPPIYINGSQYNLINKNFHPNIKTWLEDYLFLCEEDRNFAHENSIDYKIIYYLIYFSKSRGYIDYIKPAWDILPLLQTTLHNCEKATSLCDLKTTYSTFVDICVTLNNNGKKSKNTAIDITDIDEIERETIDAIEFIGEYILINVKKMKTAKPINTI